MTDIWLTSDLHLCHDKDFLYAPRGFDNIQDMNETIVQNWNSVVKPEDEVYLLGDVMLDDIDKGLEILKSLNGKIHIICGNHDTPAKRQKYAECDNVVEVSLAAELKYKKYHFFLTHYPCFTGNIQKESFKKTTCNLYGHTHQTTNFYDDIPFMYHVGLDSHNLIPVNIKDIIEEMKEKRNGCS